MSSKKSFCGINKKMRDLQYQKWWRRELNINGVYKMNLEDTLLLSKKVNFIAEGRFLTL